MRLKNLQELFITISLVLLFAISVSAQQPKTLDSEADRFVETLAELKLDSQKFTKQLRRIMTTYPVVQRLESENECSSQKPTSYYENLTEKRKVVSDAVDTLQKLVDESEAKDRLEPRLKSLREVLNLPVGRGVSGLK